MVEKQTSNKTRAVTVVVDLVKEKKAHNPVTLEYSLHNIHISIIAPLNPSKNLIPNSPNPTTRSENQEEREKRGTKKRRIARQRGNAFGRLETRRKPEKKTLSKSGRSIYDFFGPPSFSPMFAPRSFTPKVRSSLPRI